MGRWVLAIVALVQGCIAATTECGTSTYSDLFDATGATVKTCTSVTGDLTITGVTQGFNLDLSTLVSVDGSLTIHDNTNIGTLTLSSLETVGHGIFIHGNQGSPNILFGNLKYANKVEIYNNDNLGGFETSPDLSYFPEGIWLGFKNQVQTSVGNTFSSGAVISLNRDHSKYFKLQKSLGGPFSISIDRTAIPNGLNLAHSVGLSAVSVDSSLLGKYLDMSYNEPISSASWSVDVEHTLLTKYAQDFWVTFHENKGINSVDFHRVDMEVPGLKYTPNLRFSSNTMQSLTIDHFYVYDLSPKKFELISTDDFYLDSAFTIESNTDLGVVSINHFKLLKYDQALYHGSLKYLQIRHNSHLTSLDIGYSHLVNLDIGNNSNRQQLWKFTTHKSTAKYVRLNNNNHVSSMTVSHSTISKYISMIGSRTNHFSVENSNMQMLTAQDSHVKYFVFVDSSTSELYFKANSFTTAITLQRSEIDRANFENNLSVDLTVSAEDISAFANDLWSHSKKEHKYGFHFTGNHNMREFSMERSFVLGDLFIDGNSGPGSSVSWPLQLTHVQTIDAVSRGRSTKYNRLSVESNVDVSKIALESLHFGMIKVKSNTGLEDLSLKYLTLPLDMFYSKNLLVENNSASTANMNVLISHSTMNGDAFYFHHNEGISKLTIDSVNSFHKYSMFFALGNIFVNDAPVAVSNLITGDIFLTHNSNFNLSVTDLYGRGNLLLKYNTLLSKVKVEKSLVSSSMSISHSTFTQGVKTVELDDVHVFGVVPDSVHRPVSGNKYILYNRLSSKTAQFLHSRKYVNYIGISYNVGVTSASIKDSLVIGSVRSNMNSGTPWSFSLSHSHVTKHVEVRSNTDLEEVVVANSKLAGSLIVEDNSGLTPYNAVGATGGIQLRDNVLISTFDVKSFPYQGSVVPFDTESGLLSPSEITAKYLLFPKYNRVSISHNTAQGSEFDVTVTDSFMRITHDYKYHPFDVKYGRFSVLGNTNIRDVSVRNVQIQGRPWSIANNNGSSMKINISKVHSLSQKYLLTERGQIHPKYMPSIQGNSGLEQVFLSSIFSDLPLTIKYNSGSSLWGLTVRDCVTAQKYISNDPIVRSNHYLGAFSIRYNTNLKYVSLDSVYTNTAIEIAVNNQQSSQKFPLSMTSISALGVSVKYNYAGVVTLDNVSVFAPYIDTPKTARFLKYGLHLQHNQLTSVSVTNSHLSIAQLQVNHVDQTIDVHQSNIKYLKIKDTIMNYETANTFTVNLTHSEFAQVYLSHFYSIYNSVNFQPTTNPSSTKYTGVSSRTVTISVSHVTAKYGHSVFDPSRAQPTSKYGLISIKYVDPIGWTNSKTHLRVSHTKTHNLSIMFTHSYSTTVAITHVLANHVSVKYNNVFTKVYTETSTTRQNMSFSHSKFQELYIKNNGKFNNHNKSTPGTISLTHVNVDYMQMKNNILKYESLNLKHTDINLMGFEGNHMKVFKAETNVNWVSLRTHGAYRDEFKYWDISGTTASLAHRIKYAETLKTSDRDTMQAKWGVNQEHLKSVSFKYAAGHDTGVGLKYIPFALHYAKYSGSGKPEKLSTGSFCGLQQDFDDALASACKAQSRCKYDPVTSFCNAKNTHVCFDNMPNLGGTVKYTDCVLWHGTTMDLDSKVTSGTSTIWDFKLEWILSTARVRHNTVKQIHFNHLLTVGRQGDVSHNFYLSGNHVQTISVGRHDHLVTRMFGPLKLQNSQRGNYFDSSSTGRMMTLQRLRSFTEDLYITHQSGGTEQKAWSLTIDSVNLYKYHTPGNGLEFSHELRIRHNSGLSGTTQISDLTASHLSFEVNDPAAGQATTLKIVDARVKYHIYVKHNNLNHLELQGTLAKYLNFHHNSGFATVKLSHSSVGGLSFTNTKISTSVELKYMEFTQNLSIKTNKNDSGGTWKLEIGHSTFDREIYIQDNHYLQSLDLVDCLLSVEPVQTKLAQSLQSKLVISGNSNHRSSGLSINLESIHSVGNSRRGVETSSGLKYVTLRDNHNLKSVTFTESNILSLREIRMEGNHGGSNYATDVTFSHVNLVSSARGPEFEPIGFGKYAITILNNHIFDTFRIQHSTLDFHLGLGFKNNKNTQSVIGHAGSDFVIDNSFVRVKSPVVIQGNSHMGSIKVDASTLQTPSHLVIRHNHNQHGTPWTLTIKDSTVDALTVGGIRSLTESRSNVFISGNHELNTVQLTGSDIIGDIMIEDSANTDEMVFDISHTTVWGDLVIQHNHIKSITMKYFTMMPASFHLYMPQQAKYLAIKDNRSRNRNSIDLSFVETRTNVFKYFPDVNNRDTRGNVMIYNNHELAYLHINSLETLGDMKIVKNHGVACEFKLENIQILGAEADFPKYNSYAKYGGLHLKQNHGASLLVKNVLVGEDDLLIKSNKMSEDVTLSHTAVRRNVAITSNRQTSLSISHMGAGLSFYVAHNFASTSGGSFAKFFEITITHTIVSGSFQSSHEDKKFSGLIGDRPTKYRGFQIESNHVKKLQISHLTFPGTKYNSINDNHLYRASVNLSHFTTFPVIRDLGPDGVTPIPGPDRFTNKYFKLNINHNFKAEGVSLKYFALGDMGLNLKYNTGDSSSHLEFGVHHTNMNIPPGTVEKYAQVDMSFNTLLRKIDVRDLHVNTNPITWLDSWFTTHNDAVHQRASTAALRIKHNSVSTDLLNVDIVDFTGSIEIKYNGKMGEISIEDAIIPKDVRVTHNYASQPWGITFKDVKFRPVWTPKYKNEIKYVHSLTVQDNTKLSLIDFQAPIDLRSARIDGLEKGATVNLKGLNFMPSEHPGYSPTSCTDMWGPFRKYGAFQSSMDFSASKLTVQWCAGVQISDVTDTKIDTKYSTDFKYIHSRSKVLLEAGIKSYIGDVVQMEDPISASSVSVPSSVVNFEWRLRATKTKSEFADPITSNQRTTDVGNFIGDWVLKKFSLRDYLDDSKMMSKLSLNIEGQLAFGGQQLMSGAQPMDYMVEVRVVEELQDGSERVMTYADRFVLKMMNGWDTGTLALTSTGDYYAAITDVQVSLTPLTMFIDETAVATAVRAADLFFWRQRKLTYRGSTDGVEFDNDFPRSPNKRDSTEAHRIYMGERHDVTLVASAAISYTFATLPEGDWLLGVDVVTAGQAFSTHATLSIPLTTSNVVEYVTVKQAYPSTSTSSYTTLVAQFTADEDVIQLVQAIGSDLVNVNVTMADGKTMIDELIDKFTTTIAASSNAYSGLSICSGFAGILVATDYLPVVSTTKLGGVITSVESALTDPSNSKLNDGHRVRMVDACLGALSEVTMNGDADLVESAFEAMSTVMDYAATHILQAPEDFIAQNETTTAFFWHVQAFDCTKNLKFHVPATMGDDAYATVELGALGDVSHMLFAEVAVGESNATRFSQLLINEAVADTTGIYEAQTRVVQLNLRDTDGGPLPNAGKTAVSKEGLYVNLLVTANQTDDACDYYDCWSWNSVTAEWDKAALFGTTTVLEDPKRVRCRLKEDAIVMAACKPRAMLVGDPHVFAPATAEYVAFHPENDQLYTLLEGNDIRVRGGFAPATEASCQCHWVDTDPTVPPRAGNRLAALTLELNGVLVHVTPTGLFYREDGNWVNAPTKEWNPAETLQTGRRSRDSGALRSQDVVVTWGSVVKTEKFPWGVHEYTHELEAHIPQSGILRVRAGVDAGLNVMDVFFAPETDEAFTGLLGTALVSGAAGVHSFQLGAIDQS